ncbi:ABC transporter ATP-binding protein [Phaeovulum sp.]|uniref:ABC transporter ATP-binding protein n=1 Tax=Phaeovulum sp. TaxID=2934796 RepID=UPI0039E380A0
MYLDVRDATKKYGAFTALDGVSMSIDAGQFVCLLGPSGCGKTTLLRLIAGLTDFNSGKILLEGADLSAVPARKRGFGIVFQSYSLFPDMTVAQNVGYGLKIRGKGRADIRARVSDLLELIKLPQLADSYPGQLSGGQQQRVALARAIAVDPRLLLLDEPLSALDAKVRVELRTEIHALQKSLGIPTLMVTHDQEEALALADKIICMRGGAIVQSGTPEQLYLSPKTSFVAAFMGISNLIAPEALKNLMPALLAGQPRQGRYLACIRPEQIALQPDTSGTSRIREIEFLGNLRRIGLDSPAGPLVAEVSGRVAMEKGQAVRLTIRPEDCSWVADDSDGPVK